MENKILGIIGGMGPRATVEFENILINQVQGGDQDLPCFVTVNSGSIPDRSQYLLLSGANPAPAIQRSVDALLRAGANALVMPCNTAHAPAILDQIDFYGADFMHMPKLVVGELDTRRMRKSVLLATEGTVRSGLYQDLAASSYIEIVVPPTDVQQLITQIICVIKNGTTVGLGQLIHKVNKYLLIAPAQSAILGCTELSLIDELIDPRIKTLDTLQILAAMAAKHSKTNQELIS